MMKKRFLLCIIYRDCKKPSCLEGNFEKRIHSSIITTGNELVKQTNADFSKQHNMEEVYTYIFAAKESAEMIRKRLPYSELKLYASRADNRPCF